MIGSAATFCGGLSIGLSLAGGQERWIRAFAVLAVTFTAASLLHAKGSDWWTRNVRVLNENLVVLVVGLLLSLAVLLFS